MNETLWLVFKQVWGGKVDQCLFSVKEDMYIYWMNCGHLDFGALDNYKLSIL